MHHPLLDHINIFEDESIMIPACYYDEQDAIALICRDRHRQHIHTRKLTFMHAFIVPTIPKQRTEIMSH
jgi:hypothetical protein